MTTAVDDAFRQDWGRVVATLISLTGDWDLAEDCAQEAFAQAVRSWAADGVPQRPGAWLTTVARNRALDRLRRGANEATKLRQAAILAPADVVEAVEDDDIPDDRLRLIFTCCHPALPLEARVALALRTLTGLTTAEIARAFLVPEATMAKRLVRAKQKIRDAGIPYRVPPAHLLPERTAGVLAVIYLLFNEGYAASSGPDPIRVDLCAEAIHLGRVLTALMPREPEARGLLALMLLHHARRSGRVDAAGDLIPLEEQDRSGWDKEAITEGEALLDQAAALRAPGPYQVQAAIALCHASAAEASATDWPVIARLYERLLELTPSPIVLLNHAVAVAMADGPEAGLRLVDTAAAAGGLDGYHLLPATRADLLRRLGRTAAAAEHYRAALDLAPTDAERRFLARRLHEVGGGQEIS